MRAETGARRVFDIAGALGGLLFFFPVCLLVGAAILVEDGPPVFFRQDRLGKRRRCFTILKFRSMRNGRITRVGRLMRATGLDELPQFVNVLRGEMSAVGPRPLIDADVLRLGWATSRCDFRWTVPPGLTGLAQVIGPANPRVSLFLDRRYIARQTLWLDVRLIALSFAINAVGKHRVRAWLIGQRRASGVSLHPSPRERPAAGTLPAASR